MSEVNGSAVMRLGGIVGEAFGFPLIEIAGPFAEDFTKLKWRFKESRDGESAEFSVCGIVATVRDCDGDDSHWCVKRGRTILAKGVETNWEPPHFFSALAKAEAALRDAVNKAKRRPAAATMK